MVFFSAAFTWYVFIIQWIDFEIYDIEGTGIIPCVEYILARLRTFQHPFACF